MPINLLAQTAGTQRKKKAQHWILGVDQQSNNLRIDFPDEIDHRTFSGTNCQTMNSSRRENKLEL
jgi:hypothetical protein